MTLDVEAVKLLRENPVYRLGDLILRQGIRWEKDRRTILEDPLYSGTILHDYLTRKSKENDFRLLREIVWDHLINKNYPRPRHDELVIHLRLGDVMEAMDQPDRTYERNVQSYEHFLDTVPVGRLPVSAVTIVTALHYGANDLNGRYFYSDSSKEKSLQLLRLVERKCRALGFEVSLQSSENVDEDFAFMAASTYFVKGRTRLSRLVTECMDPSSYCYDVDSIFM